MSRTQELLSSEQKFQRRIEVVRVATTLGPQQALIKFGIPLRTIGSWVARYKASGIEGVSLNKGCHSCKLGCRMQPNFA